jgi:hypothetical protein
VYTYPYQHILVAVFVTVCATAALIDPRAPIVAAYLLLVECLATTVSLPLHGDNPTLSVPVVLDPSWWAGALLAGAALLLFAGHRAALRLAVP